MIETMAEQAVSGPQHDTNDTKKGNHDSGDSSNGQERTWSQHVANQGMPYQAYPGQNRMMHYPGMTGIEGHFQSLDIHGSDNNSYLPPSTGESSTSNDIEGENEEEPVKLFVGQIPKNLSEEDIFPTFNSYGPLKDVTIIRDKHSGTHRGCAFVTFWNAADAEQAQQELHDKHRFPGAKRETQVKPAEPTVPENKLFIGMLSRTATEEDVETLFSTYGEIKEVYMIRNNDGTSKCAAFLRFVNRESAEKAIEELHNLYTMEGAARAMIVKFADSKQQKHQRQMKNFRRQQMMEMLGPYPGYPPIPPMGMPGAPPTGAPYPPPYGAGPIYPPPGAANQFPPPYVYPSPYAQPVYPYQRPEMTAPTQRPREGPQGANLFVYHLPHDLTDADLATAFNPFGNVISAKVYIDKFTGESKGFGFVSYDSVVSAETAIEQMNGFQIGNKRLKVQHKRVRGHDEYQGSEEA